MSVETELNNAITGLCADKVTDRRKSVDRLKELLSASYAPKLLTQNTAAKKTPTWDTCFSQAHSLILKESEKINSGKTTNHDTVKLQCSSLLFSIISTANKNKCYIKCNEIVKNYMEVVKVNILLKIFGEMYATLILKYVLPVSHYLDSLTPYQWADLYESSVPLCNNLSIDSLIAVRLTKKIMESAVTRCHFVLPIRDSMKDLSQIFNTINYNKQYSIQESLLEMSIIAIENIGAESRLVVCAFVEIVIPHSLKFYDQTTDVKLKKKFLFKFLHLCTILHHPHGSIGTSLGCLASDWQLWNKQILSIHQLIMVECEHINTCLRKYHTHKFEVSQEFVDLAVDVCHQVFYGSLVECELGETLNPTKRMRVEKKDIKTFTDILTAVKEDNFIWEVVLSSYVKKYGAKLTIAEKASILHTISCKLQVDNKNTKYNSTYETVSNILQFIDKKELDDALSKKLLNIWNEVIRNILSERHLFLAQHILLQELITFKLMEFPMDNLFKIYSDKTMPHILESIKTLQCILSNYNSALNDKNCKLNVLQWLLSNMDESLITAIPFTMFQLIIKENISQTEDLPTQSSVSSSYRNIFVNFESLMLLSDFHKNLLITDTNKKSISNVSTIPNISVQNTLLENVLDILSSELKQDECTQTMILIFYISFAFLNYLKMYNTEECAVVHQFQEYLEIKFVSKTSSLPKNIKQFGDESLEKNMLLKKLEIMYSLPSKADTVSSWVFKKTSKDMIQTLLSLCQNVKNTDVNLFDMEIDHNEQKTSVNHMKPVVLKILIMFVSDHSEFAGEIITQIFKTDFFDIENMDDFQFACKLINDIQQTSSFKTLIGYVLQLLQKMSKKLFKNSYAVGLILNTIHQMLPSVMEHGSNVNKENCMIMLQSFLKLAKDHYYKPSDEGLIFECFLNLLKNTSMSKWTEYIHDEFVNSIFSNIHSIRLFTSYCVSESIKNGSRQQFNDVIVKLPDIFSLDADDLPKEVISDEGVNRTSTVIHCLIAIASNSTIWEKHALSALIKICYEKNISEKLQKRVFDLLADYYEIPHKRLAALNVPFLIYSWLEHSLPIEKFPFILTGLTNIDEFLYLYKKDLIPLSFMLCGKETTFSMIRKIAAFKTLTYNKLLEEIVPDCMSYVLPYMVNSQSHAKETVATNSKLLYKYLIDTLNEKTVKTNMFTNIGSVISELAMKIVDKDFITNLGWKRALPTQELCSLSEASFQSVIDFLNKYLKTDVFTMICSGAFAGELQKQLVFLWENTVSQLSLERKLIALQQFIIFTNKCPLETDSEYYLYLFTIKQVLYIIEEFKELDLRVAACRIFYNLLQRILPIHYRQVSFVFHSIINVLSKVDDPLLVVETKKILKFLLINMKQHFEEQIRILDPLPEVYNNINNLLSNEIRHGTLLEYLNSFIAADSSRRYEGLCCLYKKLVESKTEFNDMCNNLQYIRGFSEDCKESVIHKLAALLIKIIYTDKSQKTCIEATRCLGETGILNYQTLILSCPTNPNTVTGESCVQNFLCITLEQLYKHMFDPNPFVLREVAGCLNSLLRLREGVMAQQTLGSLSSSSVLNKELLIPFATTKNKLVDIKIIVNTESFENLIDKSLWCPENNIDYHSWIVELTKSLLRTFSNEENIFEALIELCELKYQFAEQLFPTLASLLCFSGSQNILTEVINMINSILEAHYDKSFENMKNITDFPLSRGAIHTTQFNSRSHIPKEILRSILSVVELIRLQKYSPQNKSLHRGPRNINFNFILISWAAYSIGAHFLAIYYCEMWCKEMELSYLTWENIAAVPDGENVLLIMRKSYLAIGDTDAADGCGTVHLLNFIERRNYFMRTGFHMDTLLMHDLTLSNIQKDDVVNSNSTSRISDVIGNTQNIIATERSFTETLQMAGLYNLASKFTNPGDSLNDMHYESCWRLGDWSLVADCGSTKSKVSMADNPTSFWNVHQYMCLKKAILLNENNSNQTIFNHLNEARQYAVSNYTQNELNNCHSLYGLLYKLQALQDIEHFVEIKTTVTSEINYEKLIELWDKKKILTFVDFKHIEPVLSQRIVILNSVLNETRSIELKNSIINLQLDYSDLALKNKYRQIGVRWLNCASTSVNTTIELSADSDQNLSQVSRLTRLVRLAEARAAWDGKQTDIAFHIVKSLIKECQDDDHLYSSALRQYGSWMVEARSESAMDILDKYLQKSLDVLDKDENVNCKLDTYLEIAKFADSEYKQIETYMKSSAFVNKIKCMESCKNTADSLRQMKTDLSRDERKVCFLNEGQKNIDEIEIRNTKLERFQHLHLAMRYYLFSLMYGEKNNLCVFRLISLWLDNPTFELADSDRCFFDFLKSIASQKFLPLIPQLAPRLNHASSDPFQEKLYQLIERCVREHPHQTLPIMLSLKNSNKDMEILNDPKHKKNLSVSGTSEDPYVATSKKILRTLVNSGDSKLSNIIKQTEAMSLAFISLANFKVKAKMGEHPIPKAEPLQKLNNLTHALVPTVTLHVDSTLKYENIPSVKQFSSTFFLVGGVNLPKKLICCGSDGIKRPLLLKGEDDIRQDAVMQQVFVIVNHLLNSNQHTRKRHLLIRTYKVVALSKRSGIIEWCVDTEPLGKLLIGADGSSGYHAKIRPKDMSSRAARELMLSKRDATNEEKLKVFKKILSQFKAVFHHFFIETFLATPVWYERRLAYTHSVATSSMIGYILGLGDRHVQNILIDKSTAEVIHIDLGIAFEQGRVQPTPETVPFRLTQDMVDAFGSAGVEGVFRRSCEKTMDVLKANHETLLTILEVLLCDPLYMWIIAHRSANKKKSLTSQSLTNYNNPNASEGSGSEAERALLRVRQKLEGSEFGSLLATPGQVSRLIQQATDINNLSRLFPGWQPYL